MNAQESETATLLGATWSALDKIMISPLASKVKRSHSPTVSKPPRDVTTITQIVSAHTSSPNSKSRSTLLIRGSSLLVETPHDVGCREGRLCAEDVAQFLSERERCCATKYSTLYWK